MSGAKRGRPRKNVAEALVEPSVVEEVVEVEEEVEAAPEPVQAQESPPVMEAVGLQRFRLTIGDRYYDVQAGQVFVIDPRDVSELTGRRPPLAVCKPG